MELLIWTWNISENNDYVEWDRDGPCPEEWEAKPGLTYVFRDLTDEEIDDVWMSPEDFRDIRRQSQKIIIMMEHDSRMFDGVEGIELRGLEHHMLSQRKHIEAIQDLLYDTVDRLMTFRDESMREAFLVLTFRSSLCLPFAMRSRHRRRHLQGQWKITQNNSCLCLI